MLGLATWHKRLNDTLVALGMLSFCSHVVPVSTCIRRTLHDGTSGYCTGCFAAIHIAIGAKLTAAQLFPFSKV